MPIFDVPQITNKTDVSLIYLYDIFGPMNGVIADETGTTLTILGTMFKTFNTIMLAIGAFMIVYVTVVGVMATAYDGQFMGKKWNNMWIPIRTVLGVASLVPTASGYSGLQIIMMWIIVQGIGAADMMWNTTLGYINVAGSVTAKIGVNAGGLQTNQALKSLFKGMTCYQAAVKTYPNPLNETLPPMLKSSFGFPSRYYCANNGSDPICVAGVQQMKPSAETLRANKQFTLGPPPGYCGVLHVCDQDTSCGTTILDKDGTPITGPTTLACLSCKAQLTALSTIIGVFADIADVFVKSDYEYMAYTYASLRVRAPNEQPPAAPKWLKDMCASDWGRATYPDCRVADMPGPNPQNGSPPSVLVQGIYWNYAVKPVIGSDNFIKTAGSYYSTAIAEAIASQIEDQAKSGALGDGSAAACASNPNTLACASRTGWLFAGAYYHIIADANQKKSSSAIPEIRYDFPAGAADQKTNKMAGYRNDFAAAGQLMSAAASAAEDADQAKTGSVDAGKRDSEAALSPVEGAGEIASTVGDSAAVAKEGFANMITGDENPMVKIASFGMTLLTITEYTFYALMTLFVTLGVVGYLSIIGLGTGFINPIGPTLSLIETLILPLFMAGCGIMVMYGGIMGIYLPLIPYIIFTMGAIGWYTTLIEAMVAGPLVALGIISPSGHHELLGTAEPALMLLFNTMLRPTLMIFGLVASMLLSVFALKMINAAFFPIVRGDIHATGLLSLILMVGAYISLVMTALNKCFSAIHVIPEKVTGWIGKPGESYGEEGALEGVKGGIASAGSAASTGMTKGVGKAHGFASGGVDAAKATNKAGSAGTTASAYRSQKAGEAKAAAREALHLNPAKKKEE